MPAPAPFRIKEIALQPAETATLTFESNENFLYDIQLSTSLEPGEWITARSFIAGTPGATTTTVSELPLPYGDRGFYRAVLRSPAE